MVTHYSLTVGPFKRGFHLITQPVLNSITHWPDQGQLQVFIQHTSAGLCINENADDTVLKDFELFFNRLAPENLQGIQHDIEGPDDMPAHIKSVIAGTCISIPVIDRKPALGTWQGIYLCEFRNHARPRHLVITLLS
jgi:secondary thiamine-phosphate synthase enzyme